MKIGFAYRDWANIIHGTPPGSILRRLLYNIFVNDVFLVSEKPNICDFADNNTLFSHGSNLKIITMIFISMRILLSLVFGPFNRSQS